MTAAQIAASVIPDRSGKDKASTSHLRQPDVSRARARVPRARRDHLRLRLRRPAGRFVGLRHELPLARDPGERGHPVRDRRDDLPDDHLHGARGPDRGHDRDLPRGVRGGRPLVEPDDRDQHPEPVRGPVGRLRHPRPGLHRPRAAEPRPGPARGRDHARTARAAGRDHRGPRGHPGRAAVDPRGLDGARRHAVADDLEAGHPRLDRRHRDRRHPRALARHRRDGSAAGDRRGGFAAVQSGPASTARSPRCRSRSSPGRKTPTPRSSSGRREPSSS